MTVKKDFYNIIAKSNTEVDILIYDVIGDMYFKPEKGFENDDYGFVKEFKELEKKYDRINIRINSPGGSVYFGLPIYNTIAASKKDIHTYNDGIAASMAAIILMAGKTVHVAKASLALLHSPMGIVMGNAKDMRDEADYLDIWATTLMAAVENKSKLSLEEIKVKYFNYEDHWFTADQMIAEGLGDVVEEVDIKLPDNIDKMNYKDVVNSYLTTEADEERISNRIFEKIKNILNININNNENMKLNVQAGWTAILTFLGMDAAVENELTVEMAEKLNAELQARGDRVSELLTQLDEANNARVTAEQTVTDLNSGLAELQSKYDALAAEDAGAAAGAMKTEDKIETEPTEELAHNKIADEYFK
jgi:ATP-dependent protease ClpP protease subunit